MSSDNFDFRAADGTIFPNLSASVYIDIPITKKLLEMRGHQPGLESDYTEYGVIEESGDNWLIDEICDEIMALRNAVGEGYLASLEARAVNESDSRYTESPNKEEVPWLGAIFIAGSITGCTDWQSAVCREILDNTTGIQVYNPRRANFPIEEPSAALGQIEWECRHLKRAEAILFWFPESAPGPIALYELGAASATSQPIFVGTDPEYTRRQDVIVQTGLVRPDITVRDNLADVISDALGWVEGSRYE